MTSDPARWVILENGLYYYLPPLPVCPLCGDVWIARGVIGPLPGVVDCSCLVRWGQHEVWECWHCDAVVAEECIDTDGWDMGVAMVPKFGQDVIDRAKAGTLDDEWRRGVDAWLMEHRSPEVSHGAPRALRNSMCWCPECRAARWAVGRDRRPID